MDKYLKFIKKHHPEVFKAEMKRRRNANVPYAWKNKNKDDGVDEKIGYGVVGSSKRIILENNPLKGPKFNVGKRYKGEYICRIGDIEYLCAVSNFLEGLNLGKEKSTHDIVIEGQIFYLAKLSPTDTEYYNIAQRYVNFTSTYGYDSDEAKKIKEECIKEIKEIVLAKIEKNYDVTRISEWNQYSRVAHRTKKHRYRKT